jgi:hypothetical protein
VITDKSAGPTWLVQQQLAADAVGTALLAGTSAAPVIRSLAVAGALSLATSGNKVTVTRPQTGFRYYGSTSTTNSTGDGTDFTMPWGSNWFTTGTWSGGVCTIPTTGIWLLTASIRLDGALAGHTYLVAEIHQTGSASRVSSQ